MDSEPEIIWTEDWETLDIIKEKNLKVIQPRKGYRFTEDSLLLADFVEEEDGAEIVELGGGSGVISLLIAKRRKAKKILSIEIQEGLVQCAKKNVRINCLEGLIQVVKGDVRMVDRYFPPESFDIVVSNPPYVKRGEGRISYMIDRAIARSEEFLTLPDVLRASQFLLKVGGHLYLIYPSKRLPEIFSLSSRFSLNPIKVESIHRKGGDIILFKARKEKLEMGSF